MLVRKTPRPAAEFRRFPGRSDDAPDGNFNFMAATIARAIIDHHQPREDGIASAR